MVAFIYNFIEYVQTEQQIYVKSISSLYFVDRICIGYMDKTLVSIF